MLRWTIGYGHFPMRALLGLLLLTLVGYVCFRCGYLDSAMAPTIRMPIRLFNNNGNCRHTTLISTRCSILLNIHFQWSIWVSRIDGNQCWDQVEAAHGHRVL